MPMINITKTNSIIEKALRGLNELRTLKSRMGGVVDASEYLFEKIKYPINDTLKRLKFE